MGAQKKQLQLTRRLADIGQRLRGHHPASCKLQPTAFSTPAPRPPPPPPTSLPPTLPPPLKVASCLFMLAKGPPCHPSPSTRVILKRRKGWSWRVLRRTKAVSQWRRYG